MELPLCLKAFLCSLLPSHFQMFSQAAFFSTMFPGPPFPLPVLRSDFFFFGLSLQFTVWGMSLNVPVRACC